MVLFINTEEVHNTVTLRTDLEEKQQKYKKVFMTLKYKLFHLKM